MAPIQDFPYELYESHFSYRRIASNTWCFNTCCPETPASSDAYLVIGKERAIMIDCGMNKLNLKTYIDQLGLTDKPIIGVINTHSHFDHTACNGLFGHAFMHPNSEAGAKSGSTAGSECYPLDYGITYLHEGDIIDLGDRPLEIYEIPAHDPGSISILDSGYRILFSGDELESGWKRCAESTALSFRNTGSWTAFPSASAPRYSPDTSPLTWAISWATQRKSEKLFYFCTAADAESLNNPHEKSGFFPRWIESAPFMFMPPGCGLLQIPQCLRGRPPAC